jgi:hypothetical protein
MRPTKLLWVLSVFVIGVGFGPTTAAQVVIFRGTVSDIYGGYSEASVGTRVSGWIERGDSIALTETSGHQSWNDEWSYRTLWFSDGYYLDFQGIEGWWRYSQDSVPAEGDHLVMYAWPEPTSYVSGIDVKESFEGTRDQVLQEILRKVHGHKAAEVYSVGPEGIGAMFTPRVIENVYLAAQVLGYDHFNWVQEITSLQPESAFERGTGIDPLPNQARDRYGISRADDLPWLYDEERMSFSDDSYIKNKITRGNSQLDFFDRPDFHDPGLRATYSTYLAMVSEDGRRGVILGKGFDAGFEWGFTQTTETSGTYQVFDGQSDGGWGEVEFKGYLQPEDWTPERIARLNAAGFEVWSVPEPSTIIGLVSMSLVGVGLAWRRHRRSA